MHTEAWCDGVSRAGNSEQWHGESAGVSVERAGECVNWTVQVPGGVWRPVAVQIGRGPGSRWWFNR